MAVVKICFAYRAQKLKQLFSLLIFVHTVQWTTISFIKMCDWWYVALCVRNYPALLPNLDWDTHKTIYPSTLEKDQRKHMLFIRMMEIFWHDNWHSYVLVQPTAVAVGTPSLGVKGGGQCSWSQGAPFTMSLWHLTLLRYMSRYVSYHNLHIKIPIILWGLCILTSLSYTAAKLDKYRHTRCNVILKYFSLMLYMMNFSRTMTYIKMIVFFVIFSH